MPGAAGPWPSPTFAVRSSPQRFIETWIDALGGLLFCVIMPIPLIGATGQSILMTVGAYGIAGYCGHRLGALPGVTPHGKIGYAAPVAVIAYSVLAVALSLVGSDVVRDQLLCSGALFLIWLAIVAQLRSRYLLHNYAVVPSSLIETMPTLRDCRWLEFDDVSRGQVRVAAIAADLGAGLSEHQISSLARAAMAGVPVLDRRYIVESLTGRTPLAALTPNEFGALLPSSQYLVIRRVIELALTVLVLPLLLPVLAIVALLVRLDGPGSVIFQQDRVGRHGRIFRIYKFRSMFHGVDGPSITATGDPRVTPIGGFLRRYRLDELPQVANVLLGDMSWVGPRPEALVLDRLYEKANPHFALRRIVLPGVTGWGQIHEASKLEYNLKLEYDLYYLKHCSLWLDLMIVLRTFVVIVGGTGIR